MPYISNAQLNTVVQSDTISKSNDLETQYTIDEEIGGLQYQEYMDRMTGRY